MYCPKCGNELPDDARFCNECGHRIKAVLDYNDLSDGNNPSDRYKDLISQLKDGETDPSQKDGDRQTGTNGGGGGGQTDPDRGNGNDRKDPLGGDGTDWKHYLKYAAIILLLVALVAAAAVLVFKFVLADKDDSGDGIHPVDTEITEATTQEAQEKATEETAVATTTEETVATTTEEPPEATTQAPPETATTEALPIPKELLYDAEDIEPLEYKGHVYAIYNFRDLNLDTFDECEKYCRAKGGHLASITSQDENDVVYAYLLDNKREHTFIGLTDEGKEGHWKWVDGSPVTYTNWAPGQPNNKKGKEHYAQFDGTYEGTWNDAKFGSESWRFLCEWDK